MGTLILIAIFLPLLGVPLVAWAGARLGMHTRWLALPFPIISLSCIAAVAWQVPSGSQTFIEVFQWIPSLGINFVLLVDGLSLFFALVVAGMGTLIFLYASQYLDDHYDFHNRFYAYLLLFMAAMLGTVFSGNLMMLFIWWELTGIASFFLIGFLHNTDESRRGARMAFVVTLSTGLLMLAGIVLVHLTTGTLHIGEILAAPKDGNSTLWTVAFVMVALGAFGKSAQFPFHFWLPNAMAAPTPVSAYLHSATMVKLGVFLIARTFPIFREVDLWVPLLTTVGFGTFVLGAFLAVMSTKLKAILAYSTVSGLGFFIGYYGIAPETGSLWDQLHIMNHVFYKGCLFMVVGIIDHSTGIKDIRYLGGLRRRMPLLAGIALISSASMAGIIGVLGFISKEYSLKILLDYLETGLFLPWFPIAMMVVGSVLKVVFSARFFLGIFTGAETKEVGEHYHAPGFMLQLPPLILAGAGLVFGLFPQWLMPFFKHTAVPGLNADYSGLYLSIWHGFDSVAFQISTAMVITGVLLYLLAQKSQWRWATIPGLLKFDVPFEKAMDGVPAAGLWTYRKTGGFRQVDYIAISCSIFILVLGWWLFKAGAVDEIIHVAIHDHPNLFAKLPILESSIIILAAFGVVFSTKWATQMVFLSTIGFLVTYYFIIFRAPDLSMTQILIEAATLVLVLLLLARFPRSAQLGERSGKDKGLRLWVNIVVSAAMGFIVFVLTFGMALHKHPEPIGTFFLENSLPGAYGTNAVNTILVDFRGFDTFLEIAVLLIAALGALGLIMRRRRTAAEMAEGARGPAGLGMDPKPVDTRKS